MTTSTARVRLQPDTRREQLLDLGVRLLSTRSLEELSIDLLAEEAGISRGLLYHYFGNKQDFHLAVVRRAVADLLAQTAPPDLDDPLERLRAGEAAYLDYVVANHEGYLSLVKGAQGGNEALREIYEETRAALTERIFADPDGLVEDTPAARLMVRGWAALSEELVLDWVRDPHGVSREELLDALTASLPALVAVLP
ncbi:TetR/AcrR family transcriptional regulator [Nocardioides perillae]|uniref:AcrR family transcriptional regulator n=1 Tax=Nocardioides perillae TaxID=1119534 RepID=A0A7Y9UVF3_9ACTN|nr:TetR/AcrR family transcriptional regulator [Nocardioides perillae]NYG56895.1 AcrR family transcriptional regulator [Nocardioides perillae]